MAAVIVVGILGVAVLLWLFTAGAAKLREEEEDLMDEWISEKEEEDERN